MDDMYFDVSIFKLTDSDRREELLKIRTDIEEGGYHDLSVNYTLEQVEDVAKGNKQLEKIAKEARREMKKVNFTHADVIKVCNKMLNKLSWNSNL